MFVVVGAATASYNNSSGVFENSSGVFENSSAVFDALPLPSDSTHDDAPVRTTYAASDELIKLMKAKPNHVDAMRHLLGTAVNKTSDDGSGRRRSSDAPKFAYDDGVRLPGANERVGPIVCRALLYADGTREGDELLPPLVLLAVGPACQGQFLVVVGARGFGCLCARLHVVLCTRYIRISQNN